jgi:septum formation protein
MVDKLNVILASNSPRRKELITLSGWKWSSSPVDIDETPGFNESPVDYVRRLAKEKAAACKNHHNVIILAADTIVVDENTILGKPSDKDDARRMLKQLRGHSHSVMTAAVLFDPVTYRLEEELCLTNVPMRNYSDSEIDEYVESGDPLDKAGAYAIQHAGFHPVENFQGCFASVMGLPLCHIKRMAKRFRKPISESQESDCQRVNHYTCQIFQQIADGVEIG